MIPRKLEPEIMDEPARAEAYARADFSAVNQAFAAGAIAHAGRSEGLRVLDLGCGPADIPLRMHALAPGARITAVDASPVMLELARKRLDTAEKRSAVTLVEARVPKLPLPARAFDLAVSNSLAHHLPDPGVLWSSIKRHLAPRGRVYVGDLLRPESERAARGIVETYAGGEHPLLKDDFYYSLLAAFTLEEVRAQLDEAGLEGVGLSAVGDRHWLATGKI